MAVDARAAEHARHLLRDERGSAEPACGGRRPGDRVSGKAHGERTQRPPAADAVSAVNQAA